MERVSPRGEHSQSACSRVTRRAPAERGRRRGGGSGFVGYSPNGFKSSTETAHVFNDADAIDSKLPDGRRNVLASAIGDESASGLARVIPA